MIWNALPNLLTIFRIVIAVVIVPVILWEDFSKAMLLFIMASISDFMDGFLARRWNVETNLGKMLDPLADKLLMVLTYFTFAHAGHIPFYIALIVIGRDVLILSIVLLCKVNKIQLSINPLMSSKINTTVQLIFAIAVLACKCFSINVPSLMEVFSLIVCASTVFSGIDYFRNYYWVKDALCKRKI